jgi:hypothetical protein
MKALIDLREHVPRGREIDQSFGFQHRKIENGIADRDPDAGRGRSRCGKHAIGQILDRKVGCGTDWNEGAKGRIVGVGQDFPPFAFSIISSFRDAPLGAGPESILPVVMDSGFARCARAPE